jgi:hypothetical protein
MRLVTPHRIGPAEVKSAQGARSRLEQGHEMSDRGRRRIDQLALVHPSDRAVLLERAAD